MTASPHPLSDEDLSAVLDGEATPDVVERVRQDPAARARLEAFRAVSNGIKAEPVELLDATTVDRLVAQALAAGSEHPPGDGSPPPGGPPPERVVAPLRPPGRRRSGASTWLVAAAVVALVAIGLGLVWSGTRGSGDDVTASSTAGSSQSSASTADGAGQGSGSAAPGRRGDSEDTADAGAPSPDATAPPTSTPNGSESFAGLLVDLGTFSDPAALRQALRDRFPTEPQVPAAEVPSAATVDRCGSLMVQIFELDAGPQATGLAIVDGQQLLVYEFAKRSAIGDRPTTFVTANDIGSCDATLSFERTPG